MCDRTLINDIETDSAHNSEPGDEAGGHMSLQRPSNHGPSAVNVLGSTIWLSSWSRSTRSVFVSVSGYMYSYEGLLQELEGLLWKKSCFASFH